MHAYNMENTNEMVVKKIAKTHKKEGDKHFLEKNISKALSSYQKAENHIKSIYSADYYKCASIYRRLGIVYDQLNNSLSVIDYFQKYIKIKSSRSIKDAKVGFAYYSLSKHYGITRNQEYKLHYLQKCIIIYEHIYNPDNLILAFPFQELGVCYKDSGNYENSFKYLEKCRILREKALPPTDYAIAIIYSHLGSYYTDIGNTTKSFEYLTKYLKILEENHPTYQLDIAAGYDNISVYYINIGDYSKALESLEKSRKIKEKSIAHDNIEYFTFYNSLGALHQKIGNLELATEYLEKSIKIGERYYSPEQPELITVKNNYASILSLKGDHEKIAKIIAENQSHSESDPRAGISYLNQAMINLGQGNTEQSQILLEKSKKILEGANPRNKLLLAKLYNNYSQFYRKVGNKQQEKYYLDKCEEITTTIEEVDKELIGNLYSNLGLYYSEIGDKIRSIEYYEKSLGIFNKATIDNQALATIYSNLALEYCSAGNKNEALSILLKCKTVFEKPGTDKKMHGNICNSIAMIYGDFKDRQKQKEYLQQAKKLLKETLQPNEIMLTQVYENLSICYVESGLISRGLKILEKCTKLFEKYHANNFTALSNNYSNLGILYCRVNNLSSGLKYLEKCKEIRERFFPPFHEELTNIYDNLSKCCGLLGLFDKQFEYLEKCRVVLEGNDSHGINLSNLYFNLASCYWMGKNMVKCMEFIEKSKDIADRTPNELNCLKITSQIGYFYSQNDDIIKGIGIMEMSIQRWKTYFPTNTADFTIACINLGNAYSEKDQYEKAIENYESALRIFENIDTYEFQILLLILYNNLGTIYHKQGNVEKGFEIFQKLRFSLLAMYDLFDSKYAYIYINLADYFGMKGYKMDQIDLLEKYLSFSEKILDISDNTLELVFSRLIKCYSFIGNVSKIAEYETKKAENSLKKQLIPNEPLSFSFPHSKSIKVPYQSANLSSTEINLFFLLSSDYILPADPCMLEESDLPNSFTKIFPRCSYATVYNEWRFLKELSKFPHYFLRISTIRKSENENECENEFRIHMDRCKMTFLDAISDRIQFSERDFKVILSQLSEAFSILKSKRIVHGDVSPGNIGIGNDNYTKIIDFGNARLLLEEVGSPDFVFIKPNSRVSWEYIAPEVFFWGKYKEKLRIVEIRYDPFKADIFSLGLTLLSCLHVEIRGLNDYNENPPQIIPLKLKYGYSFVASKPEYVKEYRKVIRNLQKRIDFTIENIRGYESVKHILKSMLRVDIEERVCVEDLFKSVFILNQGFDA